MIDEDLLGYDVVWAAAGTPRAVFAIAPRALVDVSGGRVARQSRNVTTAPVGARCGGRDGKGSDADQHGRAVVQGHFSEVAAR